MQTLLSTLPKGIPYIVLCGAVQHGSRARSPHECVAETCGSLQRRPDLESDLTEGRGVVRVAGSGHRFGPSEQSSAANPAARAEIRLTTLCASRQRYQVLILPQCDVRKLYKRCKMI